jgi:hypothetical protein
MTLRISIMIVATFTLLLAMTAATGACYTQGTYVQPAGVYT